MVIPWNRHDEVVELCWLEDPALEILLVSERPHVGLVVLATQNERYLRVRWAFRSLPGHDEYLVQVLHRCRYSIKWIITKTIVKCFWNYHVSIDFTKCLIFLSFQRTICIRQIWFHLVLWLVVRQRDDSQLLNVLLVLLPRPNQHYDIHRCYHNQRHVNGDILHEACGRKNTKVYQLFVIHFFLNLETSRVKHRTCVGKHVVEVYRVGHDKESRAEVCQMVAATDCVGGVGVKQLRTRKKLFMKWCDLSKLYV